MYQVSNREVGDIITMAHIKAHARYDLDDTSIDGILTLKLQAAEAWVEAYIGVLLRKGDVSIYFPCWTRSGYLPLEASPIAQDTTVTVTYIPEGASTYSQTIASGNVFLDAISDLPNLYIDVAPNLSNKHRLPIKATYEAGYGIANIPAPIKESIVILATSLEVERTAATYNSIAKSLVGHLLTPYRKHYARL